jgi:hypothetical protein
MGVLPCVQAANDLDRIDIEFSVIHGVRKPGEQRPPNRRKHHWVRLRKGFDEKRQRSQRVLELTPQARPLRVVPAEGGGDVVGRLAPVEDAQRLRGLLQPSADLLPGDVLGRRLGKPAVEFGAVPVGDRHLLWGGRNTVPDGLHEVQSLVRG